MDLPTKVLTSCLIIATPIFSYGLAKQNNLYHKVEQLADTNHNQSLDKEEKKKIYHELNLEFNPNRPKRLSIKNLEEYLILNSK